MLQIGSLSKDFHEIWYLDIFRKSVKKIQVLLKSDKNNGYFWQRPVHIYDNISPLNSSRNKKYFRQWYRWNGNTRFMFNNFLPKILPFMAKYGRARQATDIHSGYVLSIAFPRAKWLRERASVLRYTYAESLVDHSRLRSIRNGRFL
jgi:hypothetical protein